MMCGCLAFYAFARPTDAAGCIVFWFICVCVERGYIRLWPGGSVPRPASGRLLVVITHTHTHTYTHTVSLYQKGKANLDFTGARDSE